MQKHIDDLPVLIDRAPQVMLNTLDLDEHFVDIERIAKSMVTTLQSPRVPWSEFNAPQTNGLITDDYASFCE